MEGQGGEVPVVVQAAGLLERGQVRQREEGIGQALKPFAPAKKRRAVFRTVSRYEPETSIRTPSMSNTISFGSFMSAMSR